MFAPPYDLELAQAEATRIFGGLNEANDLPDRAFRALHGDRVLRVTMDEAVAIRLRLDGLAVSDGWNEHVRQSVEGGARQPSPALYELRIEVADPEASRQ